MSRTHAKQTPPACDLESLPRGALLTRKQLATHLNVHQQTLKRWAADGKGPRITRLENQVRHRVGDVLEWMGAKDVCV